MPCGQRLRPCDPTSLARILKPLVSAVAFDLSTGSLIDRSPELENVFSESFGLGGYIAFIKRRAGVEQYTHVVR